MRKRQRKKNAVKFSQKIFKWRRKYANQLTSWTHDRYLGRNLRDIYRQIELGHREMGIQRVALG